MNAITVRVPLRITVEIEEPGTAPLAAFGVSPASHDAGLERVQIDPDYDKRLGYDPEFLGPPVALPTLTDAQTRDAARNMQARPCDDPTVLPYYHFSIVMNGRRQLAYYTAVNIDGAASKQPAREGDKWSYDPRIAQSEQIGEELYKRNALDRGHLVRRLDPAWGSSSQAILANDDTFHFTNCSPQHARFNQSNETWQGIENYLLGLATRESRRLSIFTGPVLLDDDPLYRGVRLPKHFWKIAAYSGDEDRLIVTAYLLGQEELLDDLKRFAADTFQVEVDEIIARTGLDFSHLLPAQVQLRPARGMEAAGGMARRRLRSTSDIIAV